jgi:murein DD-endopeptidase MepM/ murein hydrolase activator NlpD
MMRLKKLAFITTIIFSLIIGSLSDFTTAQFSTQINQQKDSIKERDKQIQKLAKRKQLDKRLQRDSLNKITEIKARLFRHENRIYQWQEQVAQAAENLKQIQNEIKKGKNTFQDRLRERYIQGETYYLEKCLKADSFADLLTTFKDIYHLKKANERVIDNYKKHIQKFKAIAKERKGNMQKLTQEEKKAEEIYQELQKELKEHDKMIIHLTQNISHLEQVNEEARKEVDQLIVASVSKAREKELAERQAWSYTGDQLHWPVNGSIITSTYGKRLDPVKKIYLLHKGIDFAAPLATAIAAVASGKVIEARPSIGYGYIIVIYHGNGLATLYAHMFRQTVKVKKGQNINRGEQIASVGNNGWSTGPHLHLEVHRNGKATDPLPYFKNRK